MYKQWKKVATRVQRKVLGGVHQYREKAGEGDGENPCCGKLNSLLQVQTLGVEAHAVLRHKKQTCC